ncbi:MAG: hypothetical protein NTW25_06735 [Candidatus Kapabacteria bacterium]|nr:hypothetical protein [Candidatus Kapabacteria bacterium]
MADLLLITILEGLEILASISEKGYKKLGVYIKRRNEKKLNK